MTWRRYSSKQEPLRPCSLQRRPPAAVLPPLLRRRYPLPKDCDQDYMFSNQVDRFKRREEEDRSGGASRGLSYNKEPVSYNRGESYNSPGGTLRGGYQGSRSREGGGGGSERRNLRLDDRTGRLAKEHLHRSPLLLFVFCCLIHLYLIVLITCSKKLPSEYEYEYKQLPSIRRLFQNNPHKKIVFSKKC